MGTITSGVGLISGFDYGSMIEQLMAIEARPRDLLIQRVSGLNAQKTAYLDVSARITALLSRVTVLSRPATFLSTVAQSSDPGTLTATAGSGVGPGSFRFVVRAIASAHQLVSRGFADRTAPLNPGTLTIESAAARVSNATRLDELNGHTGVRRGSIKITNKAGNEAVVDLRLAQTVGDVIDRIHAAGLDVRAEIRGDGLALIDDTGGGGPLRVREVNDGHTAGDLGFGPGNNYASQNEIVGTAVMYLAGTTPITALNDGLGLRRSLAGGDFTIEAGGQDISINLSNTLTHATRLVRLNHGQGVRLGSIRVTSLDGSFAEVDLTGASNINDVVTALAGAFDDGRLSVTLTEGRLVVRDSTDTSGMDEDQIAKLTIEDLTGRAAQDLGIAGQSSNTRISGKTILHVDTLADIVNAITYAAGNEDANKNPIVTASIAPDGTGLVLQTVSGPFTLKAPEGSDPRSKALFDLGFAEGTYYDMGGGAIAAGQRVIGGLDTVLLKSLNGGQGAAGSTIQLQANGRSATIDVSEARTLAEVMRLINQAADGGTPLGIEAGYDRTGTRLEITNLEDASPIVISGDFAVSLGMDGSGTTVRSSNLQRQYVSEATRLDSLNAGAGIARGKIKITNSSGLGVTVDLTSSTIRTVRDVIEAINGTNMGVRARINDTGDGLLIEDTAGGSGTMKIEEQGGSTARDLSILGDAREGRIDGSYEFTFELGGSETLQSLAARIGAETTLATGTVLNDGSPYAPYRLSLAARSSGARGELIIDDGGSDLGMATLTSATDASVVFGSDPENGIVLSSATNTFEDVVDGLSLTVHAVSDEPVTVTLSRDIDGLVKALQGFVDDYNAAIDRIKTLGAYDAETETFGILQGQAGLRNIQTRLFRMVSGTFGGGTLTRLYQVGIKGQQGNKLVFDEEKFRAAYEADPQAMADFFTAETGGVANVLKAQIEAITQSDGLIDRETDAIDAKKTVIEQRVETLNTRLDRKRERLYRQFRMMESALAQLQAQQTALSSLATLTQQTYTYGQNR